jgi:hypothetical protein
VVDTIGAALAVMDGGKKRKPGYHSSPQFPCIW